MTLTQKGRAQIDLSARDDTAAAFASVRVQLGQMAGAAGALNTALSTIGTGLGFGALTALVRSTVRGVDKLNDLKDATGASVKNCPRSKTFPSAPGAASKRCRAP